VLLELGMMIALGKPVIILKKKEQDILKLPSDLNAIEIIPFTEYIDVVECLKEVVVKLPSLVPIRDAMENLEKIQPRIAEELKKLGAEIVRDFTASIKEAKLDGIQSTEKMASIELDSKLTKLEEKLTELTQFGFTAEPDTALLRGNFYYNQGKYDEALRLYNYVLELLPDNFQALANRGITYEKLGEHPKALDDYNNAFTINPNDAVILNNRSIIYMKLYKYPEAQADLEKLLKLKPNDPQAIYNLACLSSLTGKKDDAFLYLEKAIGYDGKYCELAKTDDDFSMLKDDPRFKVLYDKKF